MEFINRKINKIDSLAGLIPAPKHDTAYTLAPGRLHIELEPLDRKRADSHPIHTAGVPLPFERAEAVLVP